MLERMARHIGPGNKLPTVRDLCKTMRISRYTMDAALNDLESRGLLSRKHGSGLYVTSLAHVRRVALVLRRDILESSRGRPDSTHLIIDALRSESAQRNAILTCYSYAPDFDRDRLGPQPIEWDIQNGRVDALILTGLAAEDIKRFDNQGIPSVVFSGDVVQHSYQVKWDSQAVVIKGVQALVKHGRERIALAYPTHADNTAYGDALSIFGQSMHKAGLKVDSQWLLPFTADNVSLRSLEAFRQFHKFWAQSHHPNALLSLDDQYTAGVLHAAEFLHINVPEDLMIASHANKGMNLFGDHRVLRIEYDMAEVATKLLQTLEELMSEGKTAGVMHRVAPKVVWSDKPESLNSPA